MQYLSLTFSPAPVPSGSAARRPPNIQFSPPSPPLPFSRSLRSSRNSNIQPQILSPCPTPAIPSPLKHGNNPSISPHSSSYRPFILPYLLFNAPPPPPRAARASCTKVPQAPRGFNLTPAASLLSSLAGRKFKAASSAFPDEEEGPNETKFATYLA